MPSRSSKTPGEPGVSSGENAALSEPTEVTPAVVEWWQKAADLLHTELEIVALEGERVAHSMVALLIFSLLIGLLSLSLWFAVLAQLVLFIQAIAFSLPQALGLAMVVNLLGIWWLIRRCRHYSSYLSFPATRRSLQVLLS